MPFDPFRYSSPTEITIAEISGRMYALAATGKIVQIIDITDPPSLLPAAGVGQTNSPGLSSPIDIKAATISGHPYLLAAADGALYITNVTDPAHPATLDPIGYPRSSPYGNVLDTYSTSGDTYALVSGLSDDAVRIFNITEPASPHLVGSAIWDRDGDFNALGGACGVATVEISGKTYALVAAPLDGLVEPESSLSVFDNLARITENAINLAVGGGSGISGVQIIDISDPASPTPVSSIFNREGGFDALVGTCSVATAEILDKTYALVTSPIAIWIPPQASPDWNFRAISGGGIQIINISDPASPTPVSSIFNEGEFMLERAYGIAVAEISGRTYALVASQNDHAVQIINITNPKSPLPVKSVVNGEGGFDALSGALDIAVAEISGRTYALVTDTYGNTIQIINVTDPSTATPAASISDLADGIPLYGGADIAVAEISGRTYALVTSIVSDAVQVIDITDPARPVPVAGISDGEGGFEALDGAAGITVAKISNGTYALVTSIVSDAVQVIDITDPTRPVPVASISDGEGGFEALDGAAGITVAKISNGMYALVASIMDSGVQIINIAPEFGQHDAEQWGHADNGGAHTVNATTPDDQ